MEERSQLWGLPLRKQAISLCREAKQSRSAETSSRRASTAGPWTLALQPSTRWQNKARAVSTLHECQSVSTPLLAMLPRCSAAAPPSLPARASHACPATLSEPRLGVRRARPHGSNSSNPAQAKTQWGTRTLHSATRSTETGGRRAQVCPPGATRRQPRPPLRSSGPPSLTHGCGGSVADHLRQPLLTLHPPDMHTQSAVGPYGTLACSHVRGVDDGRRTTRPHECVHEYESREPLRDGERQAGPRHGTNVTWGRGTAWGETTARQTAFCVTSCSLVCLWGQKRGAAREEGRSHAAQHAELSSKRG